MVGKLDVNLGILCQYYPEFPQRQELEGSIPHPRSSYREKIIAQCPRSDGTLTWEGHIHQSKLLSKDLELPFQKSFGKYICYLIISINVMESHKSSLHHVSNVVIVDINMLRLVMKYMILSQTNPTLIITIYDYRIQNLLKYLSK